MTVTTMKSIVAKADTPAMAPSASPQQNRQQFQKRFVESLPQRVEGLLSAWNKLKHINWDCQVLAHLHNSVIQLQENSQSVLLPRIADRAAELQQILKISVEQGFASASQRHEIDAALGTLQESVESARRYNHKVSAPAQDVVNEIAIDQTLSVNIALVDEDTHQAAMTRHLLEQCGYTVSVYHHPRQLTDALAKEPINLVLLDATFHDGALEGIHWLEKMQGQLNHLPVIVLSARTDIVARLRAVRAGAQAYVIKSSDFEPLLHKIQQTLQYLQCPQDRVLIVETDTTQLDKYMFGLTEKGFKVESLTMPLLLLDRLTSFRPDVLILNYDLPGCNGIELGNLLRQDPALMSIPIVYVAPEQDLATHEALSLLGNACVALPIDIDKLSQTLRQEISRVRLVAGSVSHPAGRVLEQRLQHRSQFYGELDTLLAEANKPENRSTEWFLASLAIDGVAELKKHCRLRTLVDQEEVIEKFLATRPEIDGLGCCLGELRFALVLRDLEGIGGDALLKRLLAAVQVQNWRLSADEPTLSVSIGAATLQNLASIDEALEKTEFACQRAIYNGGNQVQWASVATLRKTQLTTPMRQALRNRSIKLVYQPIVNLDKEDVWFETLIRLVDAQGQIYLPGQFLEWVDTDMEGGSFTLDRLVIERSLQALTELGGKSGAGFSLVIKLTPDLLLLERLLPYISNVVNGARLRGARRTSFSLPQSCVLQDIPRARRLIRQLHSLNCGFMLEQVTPTQTTIEKLQELGLVDFFKLHPDWSNRMESDKNARETIQNLQRILPEVKLIASHIEDAKSFATLWESGVRYFQGYFIQQPAEQMTAATFDAAV